MAPVSVLTAIWPNEAWQDALDDVALTDGSVTDFLHHANPGARHLMNLDGESVRSAHTDSATAHIPHPSTLTHLSTWRELAVELGVNQSIDQLCRAITRKPVGAQAQATALRAHRHARYEHRASHRPSPHHRIHRHPQHRKQPGH